MSGQDWIAAFDALFTNNQIQKLKILLPCLDRPMQRNLAIYIKYLELQYTMTLFQKRPGSIASSLPRSSIDPGGLCDAILPYCTEAEKSSLTSLRNIIQTFSQYKEMMEMVQMMQELFPQGDEAPDLSGFFHADGDTGADSSFNMMQMLNLFQAMFPMSGNSEADEKESDDSCTGSGQS